MTGKTPFFVIGPFWTSHSVYLNNGFWQGSFYGNVAFSILLRSPKKLYFSFLKQVFIFQKICFKVKVSKTFKISSDCHIKHIDLSNGRLFRKSLVPFFRRTYTVSNGFEVAATDMPYFGRSTFSRSLVHKKNFSLIWQVVFRLGYVFSQER